MLGQPWTAADPDHDELPSDFELQLNAEYGLSGDLSFHTDKNDSFEYGSRIGDQEVYCEIMARNSIGIAERDWSCGSFSKNWR